MTAAELNYLYSGSSTTGLWSKCKHSRLGHVDKDDTSEAHTHRQ